ncbi:MAG: type III-A CRISPR-associated RAMP protein Csm3 [Syntrophomonadaceae bacterium]|nr:type III-A CRISPR-associated RAMP protein Csm3 [Syntrophomonadaceae bacterium]
MYGKLLIKCKMTVLSGMHIGGGSAFSAIGAVDSPVIRDSFTGQPIIPGSSLKGKMRTLLAKYKSNHYLLQDCNQDPVEIKRLFGSAGDNRRGENPKAARLQFADAFLINAELLKQRGSSTEVKFENTINRYTSIANPRQIERVVRGSEFSIRIVYDMEEADEIQADFENLATAFKLLSMDYIGGHGTRGYGKVGFSEFDIIFKGAQAPIDISLLKSKLKEVEEYGVFSLQA